MGYKFDLRTICKIAEIDIPEQFSPYADFTFPMITCSSGQIRKDAAFFMRGLWENGKKASRPYCERMARRAYANGAKIIFSSEQYYAENGDSLPCILVNDPILLFAKLSAVIRKNFSASTVTAAITGSVGKTTTKEMLVLVASEKYNTLFSRENANGFASIVNYMQQVSQETEVYIQEAGAFYPGLVESEANILLPDFCVITNIGTPHIDLYGSMENIMYDKLSLVRHLKKGGMAFLNYDDPMLRSAEFEEGTPITWFSVDNPNADYFTRNLSFGDGFMEYDIVTKGSSTHIKLHTYGIHNIINSVAAFAFGRQLGISEEQLASALGKYKAVGLRQNLVNIGGYRLYIDCYNSAPNSVVGSIETIMHIPVSAPNKRIVVFGDIPRMGDMAPQVHIDCGKQISKYDIDLYICFGTHMQYMAEELKKAGRTVLYTRNRDQLNLWLAQNANIGDLILFKAGHPSHLAKTIDQIFGTSYHITDGDVIVETASNFKVDHLHGKVIDGMAEIRGGDVIDDTLVIPGTANGVPVFRIGSDSFTRRRALRKLVIHEGVANIGFAAFYISVNLKTVILPSSLRVIERSAFNYCTALEEISIPDSVLHIDRRAFYDCTSLKKITIGSNTTFIGEEAFHNCKQLTIWGQKGSYAEAYAREHNIPFKSLSEN